MQSVTEREPDQVVKQRADSSREITLEPRTFDLGRTVMHTPLVEQEGCRGAVNMDLTPFLDGRDHLADLAQRAVAHGGSPVRIGAAGPGSLHTGHEAGLTYDVLTRSAVAEALPELVFLHDNAATACLRQCTGDNQLEPLPGERGINVNLTGGQHVHEWHVGGPDLAYTSSTGVQVPQPGLGIPAEKVIYVDDRGQVIGRASYASGESHSDGPAEYYIPVTGWDNGKPQFEVGVGKNTLDRVVRPREELRDSFGIIRVHPDTPGAFVWHDGARKHATLVEPGKTLVAPGYTPHGVNAVPPGFQRITLIMSWRWVDEGDGAGDRAGRYTADAERGLGDYLYGEDGHTGELSKSGRE